ncbi:Clavaminate synthase-like protein [Pholiota conissans]|uniref:Clavaminate synthase-like protein n=1 Tax=Pholiota conissans TaxID=109636 RepID=A0A9P6CZT5_9AGAR|nr:Clavaminate synthase-like protein [Pholiota conissans]
MSNSSSIIEYTPEGAVVISYQSLVTSPETLGPAIEKAFGSDPTCLGIIIVRDLPAEYPKYRECLLKLAYHFGHLDEAIRESYSNKTSNYSFGWSHGKEIMNGKPDTLKGSFYANPIIEDITVPLEERTKFPEYYGQNIWPKTEKGVEEFEQAFKDLSRLIFKVGCELAIACQPFASLHFADSTLSLADLIRDSQTTKARLLHYFPPSLDGILPSEDDPVDSWCGFHLDHSLLTGLCSAMFLRRLSNGQPEVVANPSPTSGLYIRTRGGRLIKVSIPPHCLAFQTGEALEIATNGRLLATPHCVRVGAFDSADEISRESFALFMQPNTYQYLSGDTTFGQFSQKIFAEHYEANDA